MANFFISKCKNRPKMAENWLKRGRKVRSISNSGQNFFYVTKPKIDDFIPKLRPPPPKKKHPFFFFGGGGVDHKMSVIRRII